MPEKRIAIEITSAIAVKGEIKRPGTVLTLPEAEAKNLLNRQRAVLHTADDDASEKPLKKHTVDELKDIAEDLGIDETSDMKKAELIAAIQAASAE